MAQLPDCNKSKLSEGEDSFMCFEKPQICWLYCHPSGLFKIYIYILKHSKWIHLTLTYPFFFLEIVNFPESPSPLWKGIEGCNSLRAAYFMWWRCLPPWECILSLQTRLVALIPRMTYFLLPDESDGPSYSFLQFTCKAQVYSTWILFLQLPADAKNVSTHMGTIYLSI